MNTHNTKPKIGLLTATIMSINAMIGAGIFTTPARLAHSVGPAGIITYILVIIAVLFMALSLARVAELYPQEGSFYTYTKQWGGHFMGLLAAGSYIAGVTIALGLLTQIASYNIQEYIPFLSKTVIGGIVIALITLLNISGVRLMQAGQYILLGCTLFALLATTAIGFAHAHISAITPFMPQGFSSVLKASSTAIFAFFGFESATSLFSIVKNPERTVPRALIYSILTVGAIYVAFISSILLSIPAVYFTTERTSIAKALTTLFPQYAWLGHAIGIAIITALLGVLQSMLYSVSTLIFSFFKLLHNPTITQFIQRKESFSIIVLALGFSIFCNFIAISSMDMFFNLTALLIVFAYATSIMTLLLVKNTSSLQQKIIALLGLATAGFIFTSALMSIIS
jgi:amino acid transporter